MNPHPINQSIRTGWNLHKSAHILTYIVACETCATNSRELLGCNFSLNPQCDLSCHYQQKHPGQLHIPLKQFHYIHSLKGKVRFSSHGQSSTGLDGVHFWFTLLVTGSSTLSRISVTASPWAPFTRYTTHETVSLNLVCDLPVRHMVAQLIEGLIWLWR